MSDPHWLSVHAVSDVPIAADAISSADVDVDVYHDELGCPILPGRRIQAQLHEAWLRMVGAHGDEWRTAAELVVGAPRKGWTGRDRLGLAYGARVAPRVHEWIDWAVHRPDNPVSPDDVLLAFTTVRRTTARDRSVGGSPRIDTLRAVRYLRRGITLYAPIDLAGVEQSPHALQVLARACLECSRIGLGRSRGTGRVRLDLLAGPDPLEGESVLEEFRRPA